MNEKTEGSYIVGIPRLINQQTRDFERPPTFFLSYGIKTNRQSSAEHFHTREDAEQAILRYHQGLIDSGFLDEKDIVPFYSVGEPSSDNDKQPIRNWTYLKLIRLEESDEFKFKITVIHDSNQW